MSTGFNDVLKQGYAKIKSKKVGTWKKQWVILRKSSSRGPRRLERFQDEKGALLGHCLKVMDLTPMQSVLRLPRDTKRHGVSVTFVDGSNKQLAFDSDMEANEWLDILTAELNNNVPGHKGMLNSTHNETFNVYLLPSPNLDLYGECLLLVTGEDLRVLDVNNPDRVLATWPLNALRRYGRDDSKFTFEAGRHCETGEGLFVFNTAQGDKIYNKVHSATVAIADAVRMARNLQAPRPAYAHSNSSPFPTSAPQQNPVKTSRSLKEKSPGPDGAKPPPVPPPRGPTNSRPLPAVPDPGEYEVLSTNPAIMRQTSGEVTPLQPQKNSETGASEASSRLSKLDMDSDIPEESPPPPPLPPMRRPSDTASSTLPRTVLDVRLPGEEFSGSSTPVAAGAAAAVELPPRRPSSKDIPSQNSKVLADDAAPEPPPPRRPSSKNTSPQNSKILPDVSAPNGTARAIGGAASSRTENDDEPDEYIYEEKYLDPKFRKFLAKRKDDD